MSKILLGLIICLGSSFGFASPVDPNYPWEIVSDIYEKANNSAEFVVLQQKYPKIFGQFNAQNVKSANILTRTMVFRGETTCEASDPRLTHTGVAYGLCEGPDDNVACFQTAPSMPSPYDPCAN